MGIRRIDPHDSTSAFVWAKDGTANFLSGNFVASADPSRFCGDFNFMAGAPLGQLWQAVCGWKFNQII